MDYHNVSCQTLMLHYSKDTLRYVKLFGALKSIWRGSGVAVAGREAGGGQGHCCPAAGSHQHPAPGWKPGAVPTLGDTVAPWAGTGAGTWQNWPLGCPHSPQDTAGSLWARVGLLTGATSSLKTLICKWHQQQCNSSKAGAGRRQKLNQKPPPTGTQLLWQGPLPAPEHR